MGRVAIFIALAGSMGLLCGAQTPTPRPFGAGLYDVALDFNEPLQATVRATLSVTDGRLFILPHAGGSQWSAYIEELQAYANDGGEIPLTFIAPNHWQFPTLASQTVRLTYTVDLSFADALRARSHRRGQLSGDELDVANPALFVMSDASGERTVHFIVPASFKVASPLTQIAPSTFTASGNAQLASRTTAFRKLPLLPTRLDRIGM
jgi:Peptidase M61 N-terminal domain